jgi:proton-translocating NADH-quinone oxidoreductase chain L
MSDLRPYLWLIPALPLLASIITAFFGPRWLRRQSHWPCVLGVAASSVLSFIVLYGVATADAPTLAGYQASPGKDLHIYRYTWFRAGTFDVGFSLRADALTAVMLVTVTFVGTWIAIFAIGYMSHERQHNAGYARFFAEVALFIFSMTGLVLADNFILLYAFWEGVGLCSYLLIGFWFEKPSAAVAARKAFLVTRLGDVGFILGILVLWGGLRAATGGHDLSILSFDRAFELAGLLEAEFPGILAIVCLLLLCGAAGKSAQFPLYVWLPDAMEGPTPVSALIHAATMVTAGVYLVARCMPLFHVAPGWVLLIVGIIGAFTALLAAVIALTQTDLKRVLAYSTISQIGYMFLALGSASTAKFVALCVAAAIFHLMTHAFFKALLFLSAGSVMHSMGNVIDMRRFSGLRYALPTTHWTFLCGALALAAVPPLSGFWSKDDILGVTMHAASGPYGGVYILLFIVGLITAGLTAFYTFRAYFLTFWGELRIPPEAGDHAHESPPVMLVPLRVLAVGAVALGIIIEPFTHWLSGFLETRWAPNAFAPQHLPELVEHGHNWLMMAGSTLVGLVGIAVAWWLYVREPGFAGRLVRHAQGLYQMSLNKLYVDELYDAFFVRPLSGFASFCRVFDQYVIDSIVDLAGQVPRFAGKLLRPIQNGLVQFYALAMMLGVAVFLGALVLRMVR